MIELDQTGINQRVLDQFTPPYVIVDSTAGVWNRKLDALSDVTNADVQMVDTSIVRVHQHGSCVKRGEAH